MELPIKTPKKSLGSCAKNTPLQGIYIPKFGKFTVFGFCTPPVLHWEGVICHGVNHRFLNNNF